MDILTIKRVLNNKGTKEEIKEAAEWFTTPEGQKWLAGNIDKEAALIDSGLMSLSENIPSEEMLIRILQSIGRRRNRRILLGCAAVLIPCLLIIGLWANVNRRIGGALFADNHMETVRTGKGEQKEFIFQDGTTVILNGESSLTFPHRFGLGRRDVTLEGEAYFDVRHNKKRPFIVNLDKETRVKVLGTSFNINAYEDSPSIDITLMKGCVEFSNGPDAYTMNPDDYLVFNKNTGEVTISRLRDSGIKALWMDDILVFQDTPAAQVLSVLERKYDVSFVIADEAVTRCSYSLQTTKGASLEEILDDLENISPIKFVRKDGKYVVSGQYSSSQAHSRRNL